MNRAVFKFFSHQVVSVRFVNLHNKKTLFQSLPLSRNLMTMKLDTPEFHSIFSSNLLRLQQLFVANGHEIRIAGGAVRDLLDGRTPSDLDFATTATPQVMKKMFEAEGIRMLNTNGEKHGTITARIDDENFEVTTLRIDVVNHGRHADVEFTEDWRLDAERRDLTINSMFLGFDGTVYDYFGGYKDLQDRRVVFVGDAESRIREDYLRILRYFRFCSKLSLHPDKHEVDTLQAIRNNLDGLDRISGERIWMEMKKICSCRKQAGPILKVMLDLGMTKYLGLDDDVDMKEFEAVWKRARDNELQLEAVTFFAALMRTEAEVLGLRERFKFTTMEKELALFLIKNRRILPDPDPLKPYKRLVMDNQNKPKDTLEWTLELLRYQGRLELLAELSKWSPPRFPLSGRVLIAAGVPAGKRMSEVMKALRNAWIDSDFQMTDRELSAMLPTVLTDLKIVPAVKI